MTGPARGRAVRWLAVAVAVAGALVSAGMLVVIPPEAGRTPSWLGPALAGLVAVASSAVVRVRLRSTVVGTTWTDAAILICVVCLPSAWVPLTVGGGVLLAKLLARVAPLKAVYNAGKDALSAAAGLAVAFPLGVAFTQDSLTRPYALFAVAAAVAVVETAIGVSVLSLASATPWPRVLRTNGGTRIASAVGKFAVAVLTLGLLEMDGRLLVVIPPVALCLHLLYVTRVRARAERAAWQRLAATTEQLNDTDLAAVAAAAVINAASLFSAEEVEILIRDTPDGPMLVRGDADGVRWSGDPGQAPPRRYDGASVTARLEGAKAVDTRLRGGEYVGGEDLGEVRLNYAGRVSLNDRERLALRTFASALRTAVRNATAFAEARRLALRNAHEALHDRLTGMPNRRRLSEEGDLALARGGVTAIVVVDLDMFREVNETLGHVAGDRLLVEVSRRLGGAARADDLVARLGGDEFAALLVGLPSSTAAEQRVRELLATLDAPVDLDGLRVRVEASAGVAVADPAQGETGGMAELLRQADVAMYQAKRGGPRIVRYDASRDTADVVRLTLGGDLPRAIAEREFTVSFQPIVDLASGEMISAEALARWHHPERGDLDPRRFLAAVERSGLLPAFAEAVLDQALAAMRQWRALGLAVPVAVNASPRSLLDPTFPRMVVDRLAAHGARGGDLVIELTESLTLAQLEMVGGVLRALRAAGVRLALDDFGTGHSSLAMLAKVPGCELKIDRSFVSAMATSVEAAAVVRSTVELGRSLDLMVVAEGIEHPDQRRALWELGCPAGQGHLFARPMPIDALLDLIRDGIDGTVGRLCAPMHGSAGNVVDLPRARGSAESSAR